MVSEAEREFRYEDEHEGEGADEEEERAGVGFALIVVRYRCGHHFTIMACFHPFSGYYTNDTLPWWRSSLSIDIRGRAHGVLSHST